MSSKVNEILKQNEFLTHDDDGQDQDDSFHYHTGLGKLNHDKRSNCLDLVKTVHQCVCLTEKLKKFILSPLNG